MIRCFFGMTAAFSVLTACSARGPDPKADATVSDRDASKTFSAQITGDRQAAIKGTTDQIVVALVKGNGRVLATISADEGDNADKGAAVSVMVNTPPMEALEHGGTIEKAIGSVSFRSGQGNTDFSTLHYPQFYPVRPGEDGATVHFDSVTKLSSAHHMTRYHLIGSYSFKAAHSPEPISDACGMEAIKTPGRNPLYNAKLCGAEQIEVHGRFDTVENMLDL